MAASRIVAHPPPYPHRQSPPSDAPPSLNLTLNPKRYRNLGIRASLRGHEEKNKNDLADKPHSVELRATSTPDDVVSRDLLSLPRTYIRTHYSALFPFFLGIAIIVDCFCDFNFQGLCLRLSYLLRCPIALAFVLHIRSFACCIACAFEIHWNGIPFILLCLYIYKQAILT